MNAPPLRLLMVAHATPCPDRADDAARAHRLAERLAPTTALRLVTLIDKPINLEHWRNLHRLVPDTRLVRKGRLARYTRLAHAIAEFADRDPFDAVLLTAPSLLSIRDSLPVAPLAVHTTADPTRHPDGQGVMPLPTEDAVDAWVQGLAAHLPQTHAAPSPGPSRQAA
ncbi:MAG: hypothetical protein AAF823_07555 [Planctomycetota bacterium]